MPELPEVETIRRSLLPRVAGRRIQRVEVRERRLRRPIPPDFERRLAGRRIDDIARRGKYLLFALDAGQWLVVHLGMSGSLEVKSGRGIVAPHDHVIVHLDGGDVVVFNDPRRFGLMHVVDAAGLATATNTGPDPITEEWTGERLRALIHRRQRPIKNILMDQTLIAGIGNIYANEILHLARIRPRRRGHTLRRREIDALADAMRTVLLDAVRLGGSSISDFRDGDGKPGYFQLHFRVYDRDGQPCHDCGTVIRRVVLVGRSSFYCPLCQR
jgi:formamidopyrimidine-DNA glycosylase